MVNPLSRCRRTKILVKYHNINTNKGHQRILAPKCHALNISLNLPAHPEKVRESTPGAVQLQCYCKALENMMFY